MLVANTIKVVKEKDKTRCVYITYENGFGNDKEEMFRVIPHYSKAGVKRIVRHTKDPFSNYKDYVITGNYVDELRVTYKEAIERIGELMY